MGTDRKLLDDLAQGGAVGGAAAVELERRRTLAPEGKSADAEGGDAGAEAERTGPTEANAPADTPSPADLRAEARALAAQPSLGAVPTGERAVEVAEDLQRTAQGYSMKGKVLDADALVTTFERGGSGAIQQARNVASVGLEEAKKVKREEDRELAEADGDRLRSGEGKKKAREEIAKRFKREREKRVGERLATAEQTLSKREQVLLRGLDAGDAPEPSEIERLASRLGAGNLLAAFGAPIDDEGLLDLVREASRQGHPAAAELLDLAAITMRDPLRLKQLVEMVRADAKPQAQQALLADRDRHAAAVETLLIRRLRRNLHEVRHMIERGEPELAGSALRRDL